LVSVTADLKNSREKEITLRIRIRIRVWSTS